MKKAATLRTPSCWACQLPIQANTKRISSISSYIRLNDAFGTENASKRLQRVLQSRDGTYRRISNFFSKNPATSATGSLELGISQAVATHLGSGCARRPRIRDQLQMQNVMAIETHPQVVNLLGDEVSDTLHVSELGVYRPDGTHLSVCHQDCYSV